MPLWRPSLRMLHATFPTSSFGRLPNIATWGRILSRWTHSTTISSLSSSRYMREYTSLGTAGGLYHFRDAILKGNPSQIFVIHADICFSYPLTEMMHFHESHRGVGTIMGVKVSGLNVDSVENTFVASSLDTALMNRISRRCTGPSRNRQAVRLHCYQSTNHASFALRRET